MIGTSAKPSIRVKADNPTNRADHTMKINCFFCIPVTAAHNAHREKNQKTGSRMTFEEYSTSRGLIIKKMEAARANFILKRRYMIQ